MSARTSFEEITDQETRLSAFAFIFTRELTLWADHKEKSGTKGHLTAPAFLMLTRHDYRMGMFGGGVERGNSLQDGLLKELKEELGLEALDRNRLDRICGHSFSKPDKPNTKYFTYLFGLEMGADEFKRTLAGANTHAEHAPSEVRGVNLISMEDTNIGGNFERAMTQFPIPPSLKSGLLETLKKYDLAGDDLLQRLQTGMNQHSEIEVTPIPI